MKILVTGATGKLGKKIVTALRQNGDHVRILTHSHPVDVGWLPQGVEVMQGDLFDDASLAQAIQDRDCVVHAAGITHTHRQQEYYHINTEGTKRLLRACTHQGFPRFIYISTRTASIEGGAYAHSKLLAEHAVEAYGGKWLILRLAEVYGTGGAEAISGMLQAINQLPIVPIPGSGEAKLHPLHVDDAVQGIMAAIHRVQYAHTTYIFAGAEGYTYNKLVELIMRDAGIKKLVIHLPLWLLRAVAVIAKILHASFLVADQIPRLLCNKPSDSKQAKAELGFNPRPFLLGLKESGYQLSHKKKKKAQWFLLLLFAGLVGLVTSLPQLLLRKEAGIAYQGVIMEGTDSEYFYTARIREAYDGHGALGSADLYEYKSEPYVQPPLAEIVYAGLARITNLDPMSVVAGAKFFFPALLYLVWYAIILSFTGQTIIALVAPIAMMFLSHYLTSPRDLLELVQGNVQEITTMVVYTRPVNPQFSSLIFYSWFYYWFCWIEKGRRVAGLASAVLTGLLFYIYPYSWMLALGVTLLTGVIRVLILVIPRFPKVFAKIAIKQLLIHGAIIIVITIPYWINFMDAVNHPAYRDLTMRWGFYESHTPQWSNLIAIGLMLAGIVFWKKWFQDGRWLTITLMFIALAVLINQQVLTGLRFFPGHWHWYYTTPLALLMAMWLVLKFAGTFGKTLQIITATVIALLGFITGSIKQYQSYQIHRTAAIEAQRYRDIFSWINTNTRKDDVLLADGLLNEKIPAYTHANLYLSRTGEFYLIPHERFLNQLLLLLYLDRTNSLQVRENLEMRRMVVNWLQFTVLKQRRGECGEPCYTDAELENLAQKYTTWKDDVDIVKFLNTYRLDYALWDTAADADWRLDDYPFFKFLTEINGVRVYKYVS